MNGRERLSELVGENKGRAVMTSIDRTTEAVIAGDEDYAVARMGRIPNASAHSKALNRMTNGEPWRATSELFQLQRTIGNRFVQRVLSLARQGDGEGEVAPGVEYAIDRSRGCGQGLDTGIRQQMESAFDADFSGVRVHTGAEAHSLNRAVNAIAFTSGRDIFFRDGAYNPGSSGGKELLAHELTHVVQQSGASNLPRKVMGIEVQRLCPECEEEEKKAKLQYKLTLSQPGDPFEQEADQVARSVVAELDGKTNVACSSFSRDGMLTRERNGCRPTADQNPKLGAIQSDLQRMVAMLAPSRAPFLVQRAPHPPEPLGGMQVVFDPKATLSLDAPAGTTTTQDIGSSDQATFSAVPRGVSGTLVFPVTETWGPVTPPPGPGPANPCDFCEILRKLGTVNLPVFGNVQVIPDVIIQECKALGITNIKDFLAFLNDLERRVQDPCSFVDTSSWPFFLSVPFNAGCATFSSLPPVSTIKGALQSVIKTIRSAVLNNLPPQCKDPNRVVPNQNTGSGNAVSTLRVQLVAESGGALQLVGPPPQVITNGTGAELVAPVDFSKDPVPDGAIVTIQPLIRSTVMHNTGSLSTPETHGVSHPFTVRIQVQAPPSPKDYDCTQAFGPFVIASDRFEQEDDARQKIHDWYFGLEPHVRQDLEQGKGLLRVTGRTSTTGSKTFNLALAEKRAKRTRDIIADFAGSDAHLRSFALGEFGAQSPDNTEDPNERRVDVEATGQVPGDQAAAMQGDACSGHLGQSTPTGPTGPVTPPEEAGQIISSGATAGPETQVGGNSLLAASPTAGVGEVSTSGGVAQDFEAAQANFGSAMQAALGQVTQQASAPEKEQFVDTGNVESKRERPEGQSM